MIEPVALAPPPSLRGELAKIPAFLRRDLLVMWSYRLSFVTDWVSLVVQIVTFHFVGRMIAPGALPTIGGDQPRYIEFVAVGIAVTGFMQVGLGRVVAAIRGEQLMGTLETLLLTPTATWTLQLGVVVYDLVYVPVRTGVFLLAVAGLFGADFHLSGLLPVAALLVVFVPFVWGVGVATAASVLAFKRGAAASGFGVIVLSITSGAYFPLSLFPRWVERIAQFNPLTVTLRGARDALIGHAGWGSTLGQAALLVPFAVVSLAVGLGAFRLALGFERRRGSLGLY